MKSIVNLFERIKREKRGNVFMMTGFAIIPLVAATGMGVDYARAARIDTKLSAAADAAALAAVSEPMMLKTKDEAQAYAKLIFNQQAAMIPDLVYDPSSLNVTVTETGAGTIDSRSVSISFAGQSRNYFGSILGLSTLQVGGGAGSKAARAPNIDFYLLMDTSPSMALPSTSAGLTKMKDLTGCAFACHLTQPHDENIYIKDNSTFNIYKTMSSYNSTTGRTTINADGNYVDSSGDVHNLDGTFVDSVWLARNTKDPANGALKPITLRIDEERRAVQSLMAYAKAQATLRGASYRGALFSFNLGSNFKKMFPTTASPVVTSDLDSIAAQAPNLDVMMMYKNGYVTSSFWNDDMETDFYTALDKMKDTTRVPTPGNGTNVPGDKPKGIVFIVTDGMSDESLGGSRTHRELQATHLAQCKAIKDRGLKIAILYTKYLKESIAGDSWSQDNVKPYIDPVDMVEDALTKCASTGLRYTVTTDGDIADSLQKLFSEAAKSSRLSQ